ncbi:MAG: GNAT family N-acetyltransferase [Euryarchaeota archaeon]|nr:GNAT family N-acetyltransferase [Euryarchaeota archaeon]
MKEGLMTETLEIREATEGDLPFLLALYEQLHLEKGLGLSLKEARRIFERIRRNPDYRIYIAAADGKIIGTFSLLIMENLAHRGAPMGFVENVVVDMDWRGKGVGRRLMEFGMDRSRGRGCYKVTLSSRLEREVAHRFYESLGFRKHGYSFWVEFAEKKRPKDKVEPLH